jgi:hypothetical protein
MVVGSITGHIRGERAGSVEVTKLWRISQAVKLQNDPTQLQQFYDYVKGVVEDKNAVEKNV